MDGIEPTDLLLAKQALSPVVSHQSPSGGDGRDRTDDLLLAKQALYQLSYVPATSL